MYIYIYETVRPKPYKPEDPWTLNSSLHVTCSFPLSLYNPNIIHSYLVPILPVLSSFAATRQAFDLALALGLLPASCHFSGLWLAGNEEMEKKMETTIMAYIGTTIRIPS